MQEYLTVLFILLILNVIPQTNRVKSHFTLPFSFLILWVFLAFRYYYGLDYEAYLLDFSTPKETEVREAEFIFWRFFHSFSHFYQFIIAHTTIVLVTIFYLVRRYVPPRYYAFVFFVFMCHPGIMFNYISAMRSSLASCAFIWIAEFTYIRNKRLLLFIPLILATSFIHKSALMLLAVPAMDLIVDKIKPKIWLVYIVVASFISMTAIVEYAEWFIGEGFVSDRYMEYISQDKFFNSTYKNLIIRAFMFYPFMYTVRVFNKCNLEAQWKRIYTISFSFFALSFLGLDFQNRLTVLIYMYSLITILHSTTLVANVSTKRFIFLHTTGYVLLQMFLAFWGLTRMLTYPGNYWFYHSLLTMPGYNWP